METKQTTKKALKDLNRGDEVVNLWYPKRPARVVKRINQAQARGYIVVTFTEGAATSGHKDELVDVAVPQQATIADRGETSSPVVLQ